MDVRNSVRCTRCGNDVPFAMIRYLPDGKRYACLECLGVAEREATEIREREEAIQFECVDCRYLFSRSVAMTPRACPQCGGKKLVKFDRRKMTSDRLVRDETEV